MDIVTHALMSTAIAAPLLPAAPLSGICFILGSVIPDLDAFSRLFGRRVFLNWHQTYTHGLPAIVAAGVLAWLAIPRSLGEPWAPLALAAGMLFHVGLDVTNTFGTAVLSPIWPRRFCTEWVFFIDAVVVTATVAALLVEWLAFDFWNSGAWVVSAGYALFLAFYWPARARLHHLAKRRAPPGTISLIPSALIPWRYFGALPTPGEVRSFRINALTSTIDKEYRHPILDETWAGPLTSIPEFEIMRRLSPTYHVVRAERVMDGTQLTCLDLRTRNFGGHFGELTAVISPDGTVVRRHFNV